MSESRVIRLIESQNDADSLPLEPKGVYCTVAPVGRTHHYRDNKMTSSFAFQMMDTPLFPHPLYISLDSVD